MEYGKMRVVIFDIVSCRYRMAAQTLVNMAEVTEEPSAVLSAAVLACAHEIAALRDVIERAGRVDIVGEEE